jgi:mersacidin/lichenicidin family type 2 lantibiotic
MEKVMSEANIIRAWKDEVYRMGLSADQRASLPANPAGLIELEDSQLEEVSAGCTGSRAGCCTDGCCLSHQLQ